MTWQNPGPLANWVGSGVRSATAMAVSLSLLLIASGTYGFYAVTGVVDASSKWGVAYGTVATCLLLAVMIYAAKRRTLKFRKLGRTRTYLLVHIYGGTLFLVLIFMHSGFTLPDGLLTWLLWALSVWVVGSGLVGVVLQKWLAVMLNQLQTEVQLPRIPTLVEELRGRAEEIVSGAGSVVRDLFTSELAASLTGPQFSWRSFTGFVDDKGSRFQFVRTLVPPEKHAELDQLRDVIRTKAEMDVHFALQTILRRWLWLHIPPAIVLLALVVLHVLVILYY